MAHIEPNEWVMLALYDAINRYNAGTLRIPGDLLAPTPGEDDEGDAEDGSRKPDIGWHHPSGMVGPCDRKKQGALIGLRRTNPVPANVSIMGFIGTAIHRVASRMMADHPRTLATEQHVADPSVPVRGRYDIAVRDFDDVPTLLDWKGCVNLPTKPSDAHLEQTAWYAYMAGMPRVSIQYVSRGLGQGKRFSHDWDEVAPLWERSRESALRVTSLTVAGRVAPRTPASSQDCKSCVYLNICQATEAGSPEWEQAVKAAVPMVLASSPLG